MRAFENTKRATAVHEAGHVVIAILGGRTVSRVWIKRKRDGDAKRWIGRTVDGVHHGTDPDSPVEGDVEIARSLIAGVLAEMIFDARDFRRGSSLNEVVAFKLIIHNISHKTGAEFDDVAMGIIDGVGNALYQHGCVVEAIANELMTRGELKTAALTKVIKRARAAARRMACRNNMERRP